MKKLSSKPSVDLPRSEKLLLVMYELSNGHSKGLRFEDIVVAAFQKYPDDFHLRGYTQYPDSGDLVHKPLYDFRKQGIVEAGNKVFTLTARGLVAAERLQQRLEGKEVAESSRLSGFAEREISRIENVEGFNLFVNGEADKILDTDFFSYLGVTVRTPKNDFIGRLKTVGDAVAELEEANNQSPARVRIPAFHKFMVEKFQNIIQQKSQ